MKTLFASAALAALPLVPPAAAQPPSAQRVAVRYADLDLGSASGRAMFDARVRDAVRSACAASPADLSGANAEAQCRADLAARFHARRDGLLAERGSGTMIAARR